MFIIPDEFLESSSCDVCHRFLSVGPVKVNQDGRIKCGRCSGKDPQGSLIEFGLFAKEGLFKCVNRFEGCRTLLTPDQILAHENLCQSIKLPCPACHTRTLTPSYRVFQHFKERHRACLLTKPSFRVDLENSMCRTYLYRLQDDLFFVEFRPRYRGSFLLNARYLTKGNEKLNMQFTVYFGDNPKPYETFPASCSVWDNFPGFTIDTPDDYVATFAYVEFQLELGNPKYIPKVDTPILPTASKKTVGIPRKVHLPEHTDPLLSVGQDGTSIILSKPGSTTNNSEIFMYCFICEYTEEQDHLTLVEVKLDTYHVVCRQCKWYAEKTLDLDVLPADVLYTGLRAVEFEYSCVWSSWGCPKYHPYSYLEDHELYCPAHPPQNCPVLECKFRGRLTEIFDHSLEKHPEDLVILERDSTEIDEERSLQGVRLYVWAYYSFISIDIAVDRNDRYGIEFLEWFEEDKDSEKPKPKIMVCVPELEKVVLIEENEELKLKCGVKALVTCYFSDKNSRKNIICSIKRTGG